MASTKTIEYAMPIAHIRPPGSGHADYTPFANVTVGRPFRQQVTFDGATGNVPGLELVLDNNDAIAGLFALANGELHYHAAQGTTPAELVLEFDPPTVSRPISDIFFARTVESPPIRLIYRNVNPDATTAALTALLTGSHPALSESVTITDPKTSKKVTKKVSAFGVTTVLEHFINGPEDVPLRVKAGDAISIAAAATVPEQAGKRSVLLIMHDKGLQEVNPFFYFSLFFAAKTGATKMQSLTDLTGSHPIERLMPAGTIPPRVEVEIKSGTTVLGTQVPLPFGRLTEYHGFPFEGKNMAKIERRLAPTPGPGGPFQAPGEMQARGVSGQSGYVPYAGKKNPPVTAAGAAATVAAVWSQYGAVINAICRLLTVPCELVLAIIGKETNGGALAYRCEPLHDSSRLDLRGASPAVQALELPYDRTLGVPSTVSTVTLDAPPSKLSSAHDEGDGRPTSKLHVTFNGGALRNVAKWRNGWVPKTGTTPRDPRRHFLILGVPDTADDRAPRPRIRAIGISGSGEKAKSMDVTVDDQQLDCSRAEYQLKKIKAASGNLVVDPLQTCLTGATEQSQAEPTLFYQPNDPCQKVAPSPTLTDAVQYTVHRDATLRALYIDCSAFTENVTVSVVHQGQASQTLKATFQSGKSSASCVDPATNLAVTSGQKISFQVDISPGGSVDGLRIRVHLAPVVNAAVSFIDTASHNGSSGPGNPFPATGVSLADRVRGSATGTDYPLTWDGLGDVIQAVDGVNVSPGIAQTLISTADADLNKLERIIPDIYTRLASVGVTPRPRASTSPGNNLRRHLLDSASQPPDPQHQLGWLMVQANAILAGVWHMRLSYLAHGVKVLKSKKVIDKETSAFDLPALCMAYNAGNVDSSDAMTRWGLDVVDGYVDGALIFYNAAVQLFETTSPFPDPIPSVRLKV